MGSIIKLIEVSGGAQAFGEWAGKKAKSREAALTWTYVLGCVIFIDDYLNSMTIGSCMKKLTDKYKVSREMLSYVTSSTAAPLCALIPITTWAIFAGRIMVGNGYGTEGQEIQSFVTTIPFSFYAWAADNTRTTGDLAYSSCIRSYELSSVRRTSGASGIRKDRPGSRRS